MIEGARTKLWAVAVLVLLFAVLGLAVSTAYL